MNIDQLYEELFGEQRVKETYKFEGHSFKGQIAGKTYCVKCGLFALNNKFSEWAVDKGCLNSLHPSAKSKRQLTNPFR